MNPLPVRDALAAAFARDGMVCVRSALDAGEVAAAAFDGLDAELPAGAAMDHPLFPVVWPA